jgi:hypothetical protein
MSNVEYMPLTTTNGITVAQWLGGKGINANVEADDRLRVSITEHVRVHAADEAKSHLDNVEADVLVRPGMFIVATHVPDESRYYLRVTSTKPNPEADEPASVG